MAGNPREFGDFEILRRLGVGGMAETFVAKRRTGGIEQRVCLKRVLPALSQDASFTRQFLREAKLAAVLRHSNVVGIISFGDVEGNYFMALELVDGLDLRELLRATPGRRLPADIVAFLALELAYALEYAHGVREGEIEGVVHRDISPANVLLSVHGEVKLADFGIAKAMRNHAATASGLVKGKIPYMAPEQMRAEAVDGRADLFSLGITLFEALAGRRPFRGEHDVETMRQLLAGERPALSELAPDAPPTLVAAIERLIAIDRDERTATATELIEALAEVPPSPRAKPSLAARAREAAPGAHDADALGTMDTELASAPAPTQVLDGAGATPSAPEVRVAGADEPTRTSVAREATPTPDEPGPIRGTPRSAQSRGASTPATLPIVEPSGGPSRPWLLPSVVGLAVLGAITFVALPQGAESTPGPAAADAPDPPSVQAAPEVRAVEPVTLPTSAPDAAAEPAAEASSTRRGSRGPSRAARGEPERTPEPEPERAPEPEPTPEPERPPEPEAPEATPTSARRAPGRLTVTVLPWGDVWVDGDYMGRAPTTVTVEPGPHRVSAGTSAPTVTRTVRVRAGQTRAVEIDLED